MKTASGTTINANTYLTAVDGSFAASSNDITWTGATGLAPMFALSAANFNTARGTSEGVLITISHSNGVSDTISITRSVNGAHAQLLYIYSDRQLISVGTNGSPTTSQPTLMTIVAQNLSSNQFTISMTKLDGTTINANTYLTATTGSFSASGNNITWTGGTTFTLTSTNWNTARAATDGVIVTVTHADGVTDKITIVKAQIGDTGAAARLLYIISDRQLISVDASGATTSAQPTRFTIVPQALSTGTYTISMTNAAGTTINANTYLTAVSGSFAASSNNITWTGSGTQFDMTSANWNTARGSTEGVIITVTHADGVSDKISVLKSQAGTSGITITVNPPAITIAADSAGGTKAGQFNKTAQIVVMNGQTDVSASATYGTATFTGCSGSVNSSGLITFTAMSSTTTATASVPVTYGSASQTMVVTLTKTLDGASGGTGGGSGAFNLNVSGSTGSTDSFQSIAVTNGTLYVDATISAIWNTGSIGTTGALAVIKADGTTVAMTVGSVSVNSTTTNDSTTASNSVSTGIAAGVWEQWKIRCRVTNSGAGASGQASASGTFHQ
jgi:hypothetical protein